MTTNTYLTSSVLLPDKENVGCVSLRDLIYHDDLMSMVLFTFQLHVGFVMSNVKNKAMPVKIIHGLKDLERALLEQETEKWPNITVATPRLESMYGVHHTKAMILYFKDSMQLVVTTANMHHRDWQLMTQGVYQSPRCALKSNSLASAPSQFENDLIKYLQAYNLPCLDSTIASISSYDWSACKAILIPSVPGYHRQSDSTFSNWGLERLAEILRQHVTLPTDNCQNSQIIMQCSSMSFSSQTWFEQQVSRAMSAFKKAASSTPQSIDPPKVCVVYPTIRAESTSYTGGKRVVVLTFTKDCYRRINSWFDSYLYEWKSEKASRQRLLPHIKTYTRTYQDNNGKTHIAWHLLTSANLSLSAWGEYMQQGCKAIQIKSFELGVLFCPSLWENITVDLVPDDELASVQQDESSGTEVTEIKVRLPFGLPLIPHPERLQCFTR